jgi:hypothetical protein
MTGDIPEWKKQFWAMLPRLGFQIANQHPAAIKQIHDRVNAIGDFPLEWMKALEDTARDNGVMNISKVVEYMEVSVARGIKPGERPAKKQQEPTIARDDEAIIEWCGLKLEVGSYCQCEDPACYQYHEDQLLALAAGEQVRKAVTA